MRILILSSVFPNQAKPTFGVFVKNRARRVARYGEVVVVAPIAWFPFNHWIRGVKGAEIPFEENQEGLKVYHPRFFCTPVLGKCFDGLFYFLSIVFFVCRLRKQFAFDFIDAHFSYPDGVGAGLLSKIFRTPLFVTLRGTHDIRHAGYLLRKPQIQFALNSANEVICVSESLKKFAQGLGIADERLRVIPNGIDENEFFPGDPLEARQKLGLPAGATILLSVGAFFEGKGHHRVIEVLPELLEKFPRVLLVALGDQSVDPRYFNSVKELIRRKNIEQEVLLVPVQEHAKIRLWMNAANLFCLATSSEGRCNAILEALACGLPVVTTDVGGNRELIEDGTDGVLVSFWDAKAFSAALCRALSEAWNYQAISQRARRVTWEQTTRDIVAEFERVVKPVVPGEVRPQAI
jgi:glycosyltransferase involved in cell wall biosynthesis